MIPRAAITQWGTTHPWQTARQVEQDLLLSQAMIEIANDPLLGHELVLRGGTAFHKLFLPEPLRYSEDLDYVRTTASGIGPVMKRLTSLGMELGYEVRTRMTRHPKVFWRFAFEDDESGKIKVEINTFERSPAMPLQTVSHRVETSHYAGVAPILTFQPEELVATKIRALYQRKKGRDLYDLWLALAELRLDPAKIIAAFSLYRPEGVTGAMLASNLEAKLLDKEFCSDVQNMIKVNAWPYDPQLAGKLVLERVLRLID